MKAEVDKLDDLLVEQLELLSQLHANIVEVVNVVRVMKEDTLKAGTC